jgi:uncharacterized membrane protein
MPSVDRGRRAPEGASRARDRADPTPSTSPARRTVTLALVLGCLAGTLVVGAIHKAPCIRSDWSDGRQYHLACYTDIVPLFGTEQLSGGRLPYLNRCAPSEGSCDEYPVLTMYLMRVAGWISGDHLSRFFWVNAVLLTICAAATAIGLYLLDARRALWFALAPSLALEAFVNWDLLAVALATAGTVAFFRLRDVRSGALLGLGAAAKLFPALLLIPFGADRLHRRHPDRAIVLVWTAAASWIVVNLPFAVFGLHGWWMFFRLNGSRLADWDSLWSIGCRAFTGDPACLPVWLINLLSFVLFVAIVALLWGAKARKYDFPRWELAFPVLAVFLLVGKVYSPQFGLWLLPWFALVSRELRRFVAFEIADVAVFFTRFQFFGDYTGIGGLPRWVFETAVVIRAAVLVWCLIGWVRDPARRVPAVEDRTSAVAVARA